MRGLWNAMERTAVALLATAAIAAATTTTVPGTLNYVEGQVLLDGQDVPAASPGSHLLGAGQVLDTRQGNAEMLLTPGVFLRLGANSEVRMVSPGLAETRVAVTRGEVMVEVTELFKENDLTVVVNGAIIRIDKQGLYDFNANRPAVSVLDGEATVYEGDAHLKLKKGHEVLLAESEPFKAQNVDRNVMEADDLYRWSRLRSEYESEANQATAQMVVVDGGWWGAGWYWNPFWDTYAFLPPWGIAYSPFGWGYYAPGWAWNAPHQYYPYPVRRGAALAGSRAGYAPAFHSSMGRIGGGFGGFRGGVGRR